MPFITDQKIADPQPVDPQPIFIDELVAEMAERIADLTCVVEWLTVPELDRTEAAAALQRLQDFVKKLQG